MKRIEYKLKQASAMLGVPPKDLQNLVQLSVLRPRFRDNLYWFDAKLLLQAKIAFYLKDALGTPSDLLGKFTEAVDRYLRASRAVQPQYVSLQSKPARGKEAIEIKIPLRSLAQDVEEQLSLASVYRDLPRGRKRPGWKSEMFDNIRAVASDLRNNISETQILKTIRQYREERNKLPEISIAIPKEKTA